MDWRGIAVCLGFFLLMAGVVVLMFRQAKKEKEKRRQAATALGLTPLDPPDDNLSVRLITLHSHSGGTHSKQLRNVFTRNSVDGQLILYDVWDTGGDSSSVTENQAVALIVPGMDLPRFTVFPKVAGGGKMGSLANRVIGWMLSKQANPIAFPEYPAFEEAFFISGDYEDEIRPVVTGSVISFLMGQPNVTLEVDRDLVAVTRTPYSMPRSKDQPREELSAWLSRAEGLLRGFIQIASG